MNECQVCGTDLVGAGNICTACFDAKKPTPERAAVILVVCEGTGYPPNNPDLIGGTCKMCGQWMRRTIFGMMPQHDREDIYTLMQKDMGACWGRGGHSWFPWRYVKYRLANERTCRYCGVVDSEPGEPPW